jgi:purine nucleoside permease
MHDPTQAPSPMPAARQRPIPIKVVVVTMFEVGEDTGDRPGEFQTWVEQLPEKIPFPQGSRDLRYNPDKEVLGIVTGVGTARAAASIMALGMDARFDLRRAYWLVAGIAGVNPNEGSIGSAAWAEWIIDGDLGFEVDAREMPADWPTGFIPLGKAQPCEEPAVNINSADIVYRLDPGLVFWAYGLTRTVKLEDTEALQQARAPYAGYPAAQLPPTVIRGDDVCGSTRHSGNLFNRHLTAWTAYWTGGKGRFVMTAMEDTGTAQSLAFLTKAGRADIRPLLVLRTGSNYQMPYPGRSAAEHIASLRRDGFPAYMPSLAAAYRVGSIVVDEIAANWDRYADTIPTGR